MKKELFQKLRAHNADIMAKGNGLLKATEVRSHYEDSVGEFVHQVIKTRSGKMHDSFNRPIAAHDISLDQAVRSFYGVDLATWLKQMEIYVKTDTLYTMARRFGFDNLSADSAEKLLLEHSSFDGLNTTDDINSAFRWLIPEIILAAIRTDYEASSMHQNWIASTQNLTQRTAKMPIIKRGNATPRKIGEAESIPFGTISFGEKSVEVFKVGVGFKITDELVESSSLNLLTQFLGEVGTDMSLAQDVEALSVLINGEQEGGIESAPVVGVNNTTTGFTYKDLKRVVARMERLRRMVTRIISGEDDGLDMALLEEFKGFSGDTKLGNVQGIMGKVLSLANDIYTMPDNQIMLLAPQKAMTKLQYRGMKTERRRNPQTQEDELFVSDYTGYAILRRDARVIIDKSVEYDATAGETGGFPTYMDIDARLATQYKNLQGN